MTIMSTVSMCRLCLNSTNEYFEFHQSHDPDKILEKIQKFLDLQINDDDPFPRSICQKCVTRLQQFNQFYMEVLQNQEILHYSQPLATEHHGGEPQIFTITTDANDGKEASAMASKATAPTTTNLIQMTSGFNFTSVDSSSYILTLQTNDFANPTQCIDANAASAMISLSTMATNRNDILVPTTKAPEKQIDVPSARKRSQRLRGCAIEAKHVLNQSVIEDEPEPVILKIERELDSLQNDAYAVIDGEDNHMDDGDERNNDDDDDGTELIDEIDLENERFRGFPKLLVRDSKLVIRGKQLVELMSKFYRLECDQCDNIKRGPEFTDLAELYHHYVNAHGMKGYVICCGIKLIQARAMALHMARHLQPDAFRCPQCNKLLTCPRILQYHIQNHLPESQRPLACTQCPRRFSYSSALISHSITHQPEDERIAHVCDDCGKTFASAGRLTTHVNVAHMVHGQDFICHICAKRFACRSNLTYHLTTHQPKVRRVQCDKCDKWLKNKLCLRKHMLQHSSIRYTCTQCNYSALNRQCLLNHIRVHHTEGKPFGCDVCGKTFKLKNTLINHMVQHTGIRKFSCPFCTRTFASSGNYYTHRKRMHPQELAAMHLKQAEDERILRENPTLMLQ